MRGIDFEQHQSLTVRVKSVDSGTPPLSINRTFTVTVKDVNEPPSKLTLSSSTVRENSAQNTLVGTLLAQDPDNANRVRQNFTFTLRDGAGGRFKLEKDTIKVSVQCSVVSQYS